MPCRPTRDQSLLTDLNSYSGAPVVKRTSSGLPMAAIRYWVVALALPLAIVVQCNPDAEKYIRIPLLPRTTQEGLSQLFKRQPHILSVFNDEIAYPIASESLPWAFFAARVI
jgi:hypothetical protein